MMFRSLGGTPRKPTWAERESLKEMRDRGVEDVLLQPDEAPEAFWIAVDKATDHFLANAGWTWSDWENEVTFSRGWVFSQQAYVAYHSIVAQGLMPTGGGQIRCSASVRLTAVDHLMELVGCDEFAEAVNDRARWYRVGVRIEDCRFMPMISEHQHNEVVRPVLLLLSDPRAAEADGLYRKAFDRALAGDPSGAITSATGAVVEMLQLMSGLKQARLQPLARAVRDKKLINAAVYQFIVNLDALRPDSDAHEAGTDDLSTAMLALHLTGSILLHLGEQQKPV